MKQALIKNLEDYRCAAGISARGLTIIPVIRNSGAPKSYISLRQAFNEDLLKISEVSEGGSVPELKVINRGKFPVLMLSDEELRGAKQNRVLNASILVPPESELIIPVSCTEAGRWSYRSANFEESGNVMPSRMKSGKMGTVTENLKHDMVFQTNQAAVWDDISELQAEHKIRSGTSAMADAYEARKPNLEEFVKVFDFGGLTKVMSGILVEIDGSLAGLELVSQPDIWQDIREKIIRSYAIEVINRPEGKPRQVGTSEEDIAKLLGTFDLETYKSVGLGDDLRLEKQDLVGSALVWENELIHLAAYPRSKRERPERYRSRRM